MMTQSLNGNDSPFHCPPQLSELDAAAHDPEIYSLYPDSMTPIQPTGFDKEFTIEGDKVYEVLSKSSGSSSPSSSNQSLHKMETTSTQPLGLPPFDTFCRSRDNSMSSPTHHDCLSTRITHSPISVAPAVRRTWKSKHPINWNSEDVLDWVFQVAEMYGIDGAIKSETFQDYSGKDLLDMPARGFLPLSNEHYYTFYMHFDQLRERSRFNGPETIPESPLLSSTSEHLIGNGSKGLDFDCDMIDTSTGVVSSDSTTLIQIDSYNYPVDLTDKFLEVSAQRQAEAASSDDGYSSGSDRTPVIVPTTDFGRYPSQGDHAYKSAQIPDLQDLVRRSENPMDDSDPEDEAPADDVTPRPDDQRRRGRKPGQTTRGNHLWEFVRDLLKDPRYNPTLIKWENRELGVFRFVQSAAVAKMWGRRKNNQTMNYEKLSRAMRFCRDKQYFAGLPKGGKYPKKLCFRFGERAFGWQTDE